MDRLVVDLGRIVGVDDGDLLEVVRVPPWDVARDARDPLRRLHALPAPGQQLDGAVVRCGLQLVAREPVVVRDSAAVDVHPVEACRSAHADGAVPVAHHIIQPPLDFIVEDAYKGHVEVAADVVHRVVGVRHRLLER